jgi:Ca-activated chloride channel family protein
MLTVTPARAKLDHTQDRKTHALFTFTPPKMEGRARPPLDLSLALDVSGSMRGTKLDQVRRSVLRLIQLLGPEDRIAITLFETHVTTLAELVHVTPEARPELEKRVREIRDAGSTNLSGGLFQALDFLTSAKVVEAEGRVRRALLFTDGQANVGISDAEKLVPMTTELRQGVGISTFGYGTDHDAALLQKLAQGGGFYYIDGPDKILSSFGAEFGALVTLAAQNVELRLQPVEAEGVKVLEVLNDLDVDGPDEKGTFKVRCDDLLAGQPYPIAVVLDVPKGDAGRGPFVAVHATGRYLDLAAKKHVEVTQNLVLERALPNEANAGDDPKVMEEVGLQMVAKATAEALERAERGDYNGAGIFMVQVADEVKGFAPTAEKIAVHTRSLIGSAGAYKGGGGHMSRNMGDSLKRRYRAAAATGQGSYGSADISFLGTQDASDVELGFTADADDPATAAPAAGAAPADPAGGTAAAVPNPPAPAPTPSPSKKRRLKKW